LGAKRILLALIKPGCSADVVAGMAAEIIDGLVDGAIGVPPGRQGLNG
jgi:hypothetical protein